MNEQMNGEFRNQNNSEKERLEPDYSDGLNIRLMFLDFILQAINL